MSTVSMRSSQRKRSAPRCFSPGPEDPCAKEARLDSPSPSFKHPECFFFTFTPEVPINSNRPLSARALRRIEKEEEAAKKAEEAAVAAEAKREELRRKREEDVVLNYAELPIHCESCYESDDEEEEREERVMDAFEEERNRPKDEWSPAEVAFLCIQVKSYVKTAPNFNEIASKLPSKSAGACLDYYTKNFNLFKRRGLATKFEY